jgi:hypothetical protein
MVRTPSLCTESGGSSRPLARDQWIMYDPRSSPTRQLSRTVSPPGPVYSGGSTVSFILEPADVPSAKIIAGTLAGT